MGAGILPVAYHKGNWYFLFARDYYRIHINLLLILHLQTIFNSFNNICS